MNIKKHLDGAKRSFTLWFNGVSLTLIEIFMQVKDFMPQIEDYLDDAIFKRIMLFVIIGGNILLRFKTNSALSDKAKGK